MVGLSGFGPATLPSACSSSAVAHITVSLSKGVAAAHSNWLLEQCGGEPRGTAAVADGETIRWADVPEASAPLLFAVLGMQTGPSRHPSTLRIGSTEGMAAYACRAILAMPREDGLHAGPSWPADSAV